MTGPVYPASHGQQCSELGILLLEIVDTLKVAGLVTFGVIVLLHGMKFVVFHFGKGVDDVRAKARIHVLWDHGAESRSGKDTKTTPPQVRTTISLYRPETVTSLHFFWLTFEKPSW